jgi:lactoylglutathione lyase
VETNRELASWLISHRNEIEAAMNLRLGPAAPSIASPEAEALRRFRTYASAALVRNTAIPPALDGLKVNQRRTEALILAWLEAAAQSAGTDNRFLRDSLTPLISQFRIHLRGTSSRRKTRGTPRVKRRTVVAAIDRLAEAFLAVDTDTGTIEDANPAAGALLGLKRDELLGVDAMSFVPTAMQAALWCELDAVGEGVEAHSFAITLYDSEGTYFEMSASTTRFATRDKTLALILLRPRIRTECAPGSEIDRSEIDANGAVSEAGPQARVHNVTTASQHHPNRNPLSRSGVPLKYLHTMVRVSDLDESLAFYVGALGLVEVNRVDVEAGRFTLCFLAAPGDESAQIELTYNWDAETYTGGRNFGHVAYEVDDIYQTCQRLQDAGVTINRPPRDGHMAFVRSPEGISVELLQKSGSLPVQEPWQSMENVGEW